MSLDLAATHDQFFSQYPKRTYAKGQMLISPARSPKHMYYAVSGKIRKYDVSYRGDEIIVHIFKAPGFFPLSLIQNSSPNKFYYKAEEACELHAIPVADAVAYLHDNPDLMLEYLGLTVKAMDDVFMRLARLMSGTAKSRLAYELAMESRKSGKKMDKGRLVLDVRESDLVKRTGLSTETVHRELHKLQEQQFITVGSSAIVVTDISGLEQLYGAEV